MSKDRTVADLEIGEGGWTAPWSAIKTTNEGWKILNEALIFDDSGGSATMWVEKTDKGYFADLKEPHEYKTTETYNRLHYSPLPRIDRPN